ncbi:DNA helicase-2 / ATP-dependent DNA helicase PcrA [Gracilibacillus orientalis]|uniref:DNA helicase-2 / ATP-dependent DNA helicase PcrA n=1 Tax=Gracilibacillus orientalis TaxID=334253 RepID=A0A1I4R3Q4_9BACI|nr:RNA polymerase recycling motor HelD [Gracilibacillus orientalis]SFM46932.1 DNA helicase-2 / ATP-dependent DNA helicase PcrA [Gracilibacillus orientalis]
MSEENKNREAEQHRVNHVIEEIDQRQEKLYTKLAGLKESVINLRQNFWEDVSVNLEESDDVIETHASIKQQAELLSERELFHGKIDEELKTLKKLKNNPYFGRIDFREDGESTSEPIYIGIASLMDHNDDDFLVFDWRAPISSLYYDYSSGKAQYQTMDGTITGEMTLKRQFMIRNGAIKGMFDTGVTIGDELLQQALGNNASTTMKSIVSTIQKEQNKIIRDEQHRFLVVQGVAGSGKTSAALQRIAYLMYRYRETLNKDNVVLFSPNPLFSSYVANVLPELGEANVRQTTFYEYLVDKIGSKLTVESPFQHMEDKLTEVRDTHYHTKKACIDYKSSLNFKQHLDEYMSSLTKDGLQFKNISFRKEVLVTKEQIRDYFYSLDPTVAIPNKLELVAKWLLREIKKQQQNEKNKDWVMEQMELLDKEEYLQAHYHMQAQDQDELYADETEEDFLRGKVVQEAFASLKQKVKQFQFVHILETYKKLFTDWPLKNAPEYWDDIREWTSKDLSQGYLAWEEATAFLYFKVCILGDTTDRSVRHLFIDEAQDYSPFQFAYIKEQFPYTRMTLLGDINQAIYTHEIKGSPLVPNNEDGSYERIVLTKSYRSTKQIVDFTTYFAPEGEMIEPFNREGQKPELVIHQGNIVEPLLAKIKALQENGHETIALICKTQQECDELLELLSDSLLVTQINEKTRSYQKGILLLPVYLAKGIEFDAVVIPNVSEAMYAGEAERTLFYTACTRAMHELVMLTDGKRCPFILEVPEDKYKVITG